MNIINVSIVIAIICITSVILIGSNLIEKDNKNTESVIQLLPQTSIHIHSKALTYIYVPTNTPQTSNTPQIRKDYIKVTHSYRINEYVSMRECPAPSGKIYLIVTMNIENHGYGDFTVNNDWWTVTVNEVQYSRTYATYYLDDQFKYQKILNGGEVSGSIAFEIPKNGINASDYTYSIYNDKQSKYYNIKYVKK